MGGMTFDPSHATNPFFFRNRGCGTVGVSFVSDATRLMLVLGRRSVRYAWSSSSDRFWSEYPTDSSPYDCASSVLVCCGIQTQRDPAVCAALSLFFRSSNTRFSVLIVLQVDDAIMI